MSTADIPARQHVGWCAEGAACGLGEHRSAPHVSHVPGVGRVTVTRVRAGGRDHAEVRLTVTLSGDEGRARWQLVELMRGLVVAVSRARR